MKNAFLNCKDCNPRIMDEEGCCTANVGNGIKRLVNSQGIRITACALLIKFDDGSWGCGDYERRPEICKSFYCHRAVNIK